MNPEPLNILGSIVDNKIPIKVVIIGASDILVAHANPLGPPLISLAFVICDLLELVGDDLAEGVRCVEFEQVGVDVARERRRCTPA
jgi:hypothetical protein